MSLAKRISLIKPSPTLAVDAKAKAMKKTGVDMVNFGVGEPDFDTPDHIKAAAVKALEEGFTKYTPVGGIDELKEAIIHRTQTDLGLTYTPEEVVVSCGGKHSLYNLAQALWNEGDEVLIPAPYWVSYPPIVLLAGAEPVIIPTCEENGFKMTPEDLKKAVTGRTRALILNSPSNPTGSVYTRAELEALAPIILEYGLTVVSDDIYDKILFDGVTFANTASLSPELKALTYIVNGLSKAYAMTGWRIGYLLGPKEGIGAVTKIQSQSTSNPNSIAQKAGVEALNGPQEFIGRMAAEFDLRRRFLHQALNQIPGVKCALPQGAFYLFPNFSAYYGKSASGRTIVNSTDLADFFLEAAHVALVPGVAFGEDACLRFSYATSMIQIEEGVKRIQQALTSLR
jgi:aspartate aminotransferase